MWIAAMNTNGQFPEYFEETTEIVFYELYDGEVHRVEMIEPDAKDPSELVDALLEFEAELILCNKIKEESKKLLEENGVGIICDRSGASRNVVDDYLAGKIVMH